MNPEDEKEFIRSALEDPRADLPPELVEDLSPEERAMYRQHRILDGNLRSGLKDLTAHIEKDALQDEVFKARLMDGIRKAPEPAGLFLLKLRLQEGLERLREIFWYQPGNVYRWTPALIILLIIPIVPLMLNESKKQEATALLQPGLSTGVESSDGKKKTGDTENAKTAAESNRLKARKLRDGLKKSAKSKPRVLAFRGTPKNKPTPTAPRSTDRFKRKADSVTDAKKTTAARSPVSTAGAAAGSAAAEKKTKLARRKGKNAADEPSRYIRDERRSRASRSAPKPSVAKPAEPARKVVVKKEAVKTAKTSAPKKEAGKQSAQTREQKLLARLQKASTPEEKRKVLKELEQLYRAKSAVQKLRRIREKLKTFK